MPSIISSLLLLVGVAPCITAQTRPSYHIIPEEKWLNDPQRPIFAGGEWHLYYLYNSNWDKSNPGAGGTEWFHVTSTNMVDWTHQGVVIQKYKPNPSTGVVLGDIETGSSVIDTANTAGFGQNAVIAILTQMQDGIQQQSLFYSNDNGATFTAYGGNPVMPSPDAAAKPAFRDPKIIWDEQAGQWVIALSEGSKIGFYVSKDLKAWTYVSGFSPIDSGVDLGTLECADMYEIDLDGNSASRTWILASGANGYKFGKTTGTAYWAGTWNGTHFAATTSAPRWIDEGPDFYATVSWENTNDKFGSRYAIAWMNNWEYANTLPYYGGYEGQLSMVRELKYRTIGGTPTLVSVPIAGYAGKFKFPISTNGSSITTDAATASLPSGLTGGAYVIRATVTKEDGDDGNEVHFRIKSNGAYNTTIGYSFSSNEVFLAREADGPATDALASAPKQAYNAVRSAVNLDGGSTIKLAIYVDYNSVETFVNDQGVASLSGLVYPAQGAEGEGIKVNLGVNPLLQSLRNTSYH
ncbi:glycosyl hydrolase [Phaeosphaeria sp. MPI-PUGE-AT-0046c]|nr:glycosyl hydrolase [Phaeosphaeria sp. MPI-PUGE-AT-0046c]